MVEKKIIADEVGKDIMKLLKKYGIDCERLVIDRCVITIDITEPACFEIKGCFYK